MDDSDDLVERLTRENADLARELADLRGHLAERSAGSTADEKLLQQALPRFHRPDARADSRRVVGPVHPSRDAARAESTWNAALASGQPFECEYRLRHADDGSYRWFRARGVAVRDGDGRITRGVGSSTDIEDRRTCWTAFPGLMDRIADLGPFP